MKKLSVFILTFLLIGTLLAQEEVLVVVYEKELEGILTTSGEYFSNQKLSAGHESLPMGSVVEFFNPRNQNKVKISINDRIPDTEGMFWISDKAAKELDIKSIYPTKVLATILHQPEVEEVYQEIDIPIPEPPVFTSPIKVVSYHSPTVPASSPEAPAETDKIEEIDKTIEIKKIDKSATVGNSILDGLSENLGIALNNPEVPKSTYANIYTYGVHIYTTINSDEAIEVSRRLYDHFDCFSYIEKYHSPLGNCYRVIAGGYSSEAEALDCYNKLVESIPNIFLVKIY